jgi:hypothetical protein
MRGLLYMILALFLTGCSLSKRDVAGLDEAEMLMSSDPTAALECLNGCDVSEFADSATLARWALLYSEAMVANRLAAPNDTIVDIAVRYYGAHGRREEFERASGLKALIRDGGRSDELATALYLRKEREFMLYRERARAGHWFFCGLLVLALAVGVIFWQRQRLRGRERENERLIDEASGLRQGMSQILSGRFAQIDELCQTWYETQGTRAERKAIVERVLAQIDGLRGDAEMFSEMERCVRSACGELLARVEGRISPEDYRLLVYLGCQFSNRSIALLLNESIGNVYKRKSRLKARITAIDSVRAADVDKIF